MDARVTDGKNAPGCMDGGEPKREASANPAEASLFGSVRQAAKKRRKFKSALPRQTLRLLVQNQREQKEESLCFAAAECRETDQAASKKPDRSRKRNDGVSVTGGIA